MSDAIDLTGLNTPTPPAPTPVVQEKTKEDAIEYLLKIKARVLEFAGKDGYNPFVWLEYNGVNDYLTRLRGLPTKQDIEHAFTIEFQEPALSTIPSYLAK